MKVQFCIALGLLRSYGFSVRFCQLFFGFDPLHPPIYLHGNMKVFKIGAEKIWTFFSALFSFFSNTLYVNQTTLLFIGLYYLYFCVYVLAYICFIFVCYCSWWRVVYPLETSFYCLSFICILLLTCIAIFHCLSQCTLLSVVHI